MLAFGIRTQTYGDEKNDSYRRDPSIFWYAESMGLLPTGSKVEMPYAQMCWHGLTVRAGFQGLGDPPGTG